MRSILGAGLRNLQPARSRNSSAVQGRIKELEIPVLVLNCILYIVGGAAQQQGSHI